MNSQLESMNAIINEITNQKSDINLNKMLFNTDSDPNCLKMNEFKIVPSKIISTLINFKKEQLNSDK